MRGSTIAILLLISIVLVLSCSTDSKPVYKLSTSVEPAEAGSVTQSAAEAEDGGSITITANANEHWLFDRWSGDHSGTENSASILMDRDKNITALFFKRDYPLTVEIQGEGSVDERVIQQKSTDYPHGTVVELTAEPAKGWLFVEWQGDLSGDENPQTVIIDGETRITALFEVVEYPLTINIEGEGEVEQKVVQPKTTEYPEGTVVELEAIADENWLFSEWSGDITGEENPVTITIDEPKTVTAIFLRTYKLTTITEPEEAGTVIPETTQIIRDTDVDVEAIANHGWVFSHWGGDFSGSVNPFSLTMDGNKTIVANFEREEYLLNITIDGEGTVEQEVITAKTTGYPFETLIKLTAIPDDDWMFSNWSGDLHGADPETEIVIDGEKFIKATFIHQSACREFADTRIGVPFSYNFQQSCSIVLSDVDDAVYRVGIMARNLKRTGAVVDPVPGNILMTFTQENVLATRYPEMMQPDFLASSHHTSLAGTIDDEIEQLMRRTERVHIQLREQERTSQVPGAVRGRYPHRSEFIPLSPEQAKKEFSVETEPEQQRIFYANNPSGGLRIEIPSTLRKIGNHILYYEDDSVQATSEQATDEEIERLLEYYDHHGKNIIDDMFGGLGPVGTTNHFIGPRRLTNDIDGNGKFIVLQLHSDHMIGGAAGYVSSCDRDPTPENYFAGGWFCTRSNEAEITYILHPESDFYLGTLVHEAKHISSHGYAIFTDRGFQPSWIEEGTAEIAKEMSSRSAAGYGNFELLGIWDIYNNNRRLSAETSGIGVVYHRSRRFLKASPISALIGNPDNNINASTFYGASWLFHRYLADQYAANQADPFFRQLNDGTYQTGSQGIRDATGVDFNKLLNEFMHSILVNGELSTFETTPYSFRSLQFKDISSYFLSDEGPREWPYLQQSMPFQSSSLIIDNIHYTSPVFYEFIANGQGDIKLELYDENGNQLNPEHDVSIKIIRIK